MDNSQLNPPLILKNLNKDKLFTLKIARDYLETVANTSIEKIRNEYSELKAYELVLRYFTTSNKIVCEVMQIPVEAGTRYKANLEKKGLLIASKDTYRCPFTGEMVSFLSTNPNEFGKLAASKKDNQLELFV